MQNNRSYSLTLDNSIYPKTAIFQAKTAYSKYASFVFAPKNSSEVIISITVKNEYLSQGREIALSFLNYALDLSIQDIATTD